MRKECNQPPAQEGNREAPPNTSAGGRGAGRGRHCGGRGQNREEDGQGKGNTNGRASLSTGAVFKGNTNNIKNHVFHCHGETTIKQQFSKTLGMTEELINKTFAYPQDVAFLCKTLVTATLVQVVANLTKAEDNGDMGKKIVWELSMKTYLKWINLLDSNKRSIYAIVWGQCSPMM